MTDDERLDHIDAQLKSVLDHQEVIKRWLFEANISNHPTRAVQIDMLLQNTRTRAALIRICAWLGGAMGTVAALYMTILSAWEKLWSG